MAWGWGTGLVLPSRACPQGVPRGRHALGSAPGRHYPPLALGALGAVKTTKSRRLTRVEDPVD